MTDSSVPDWVKAIEKQHQDDATQRRKRDTEAFALEKAIQADGPVFCQRLSAALFVNAEACKRIGVTVVVEDIGELKPGRLAIQVRATQAGFRVRTAYAYMFHDEGQSYLKCSPESGQEYRLDFCVGAAGELVAVSALDGEVLNPEQVAASIVSALHAKVSGE